MSKARRKRWGWRAVAAGSIKAISYHITVTYVLPIGAPIVTVYLGYIQSLPWMYVWLGALAAFAIMAHGLLRYDEWRLRRRVEDRLAFQSVILGPTIKNDGLTIGLQLVSSAAFPVEFEITKIATRLGNTVPLETSFKITKFIIPPNGIGWFRDHPIQIQNPPKPGTMEGFIEYEINYGRVGSLTCHLSGKKQVVAAFNEDGIFFHYG